MNRVGGTWKGFETMVEYKVCTSPLGAAAGVLETRFEEILANYEERLLTMSNPLVAEAETREQLRAHARSVLEEVAANLRGREAPSTQQKDPLPETIGVLLARKGVHPSESLRDVVALSEAALPVVVDNLPPSPTSRSEIAVVDLAIQK